MKDQFSLYIGKKNIFTYPLSIINNQNNNNNTNNNIKLQEADIVPKFIAVQNMRELKDETHKKLSERKNVLNKLLSECFKTSASFYSNEIQQIENDLNGVQMCMEKNKDGDYNSCMKLINILSNLGSHQHAIIQPLINMNFYAYKQMTFELKNKILQAINLNKKAILEKSGVDSMVKIVKNPYILSNCENNTKAVSDEKIKLFKILIRNPDIPSSHVVNYFDIYDQSVSKAGDNYFRNFYGTEQLTLNYFYPSHKNQVITHRFNFLDSIDQFIMAAQNDFISMDRPVFYDENGKLINTTQNVKLLVVGALGLKNNAKIKVVQGVR